MDDRRRTPGDGKSSYCLRQGLLKWILKYEYLLVMYRLNMLHYISISLFLREIMARVLSFSSLGKSYLSINRGEDFFFRNQPIRNKNWLWWPCLLTDWYKMSNRYREPFIDASYQVSIHLAKRFQRRRFVKISQSETRIACGGHVC